MNIIQGSQVEAGERKFIKIESKSYKNQRFEFQSYELAFAVRQMVYLKIIKFDANNDQQFQESQIKEFLQTVMHESETEIKYVVRNVFRYDYNNDGVIEYDELVNFCMEQHFGELAIQRLHKKKLYKKGSQRLMDEKEFYETVKYALSFVDFKPNDSNLKMAFDTIDNDKDNQISYEDYFRFLKEYFGTKSYAASLVNKKSIFEELHNSHQHMPELINIVKRYSKYDKGGNNAQNLNIPIPNQSSIKITPPITSQRGTPQSNVSNTSNLMASSNANKKGSKIELTLIHKGRQSKNQVILNPAQQTLANQIAKLVYTQLIVSLANFDNDRDCMLSSEDVIAYMKANFNYGDNAATEVYRKHNLVKNKLISYAQSAKILINEQIARFFKSQNYENATRTLSLQQFCQTLQKICSIVKNTPIRSKYQTLYNMRTEKEGLSSSQAQNLVSFIFNHYQKK